ncbi:hypothetical protein [Ralstonia wenshanensis]|uniref:hypothetical protein n=1 Tax=Ralstonia wenshanensis TaxID=2842456 RepID=UPI003D960FFB
MRQTYGALCALAEQHGVKMTEEVRALLRAVERVAEAEADAQPIAWESTTPFYRKYLTQAKYDRLGDQFRKWYKPYRCSNCAAPAPVPHIKTMVDRFLGWRLPDDFAPDCGISFTPLGHPNGWPVGTNLLTAAQAEAMFLHALGVSGEPPHAECPPPLDATEAAEREHMGCAHCRTGIYAQQHCINCGLNVSPSCDCHRGRAARKISQQDPEPIYQVVAGEDPDIWRDVTAAEYGERLPSSRRRMYFAPKAAPKCWCYICNKDRMEYGVPYVMTHMIVCPSCGNKRCPRATDHRVACTNSNEPGQPGSRY